MLCAVSTAFSSSSKLSRVFLQLDRNKENMFSISLRKQRDEKKENNLLSLITKMYILFAGAIITSTALASSVSPSSYRNTISNKSALVFSQECLSLHTSQVIQQPSSRRLSPFQWHEATRRISTPPWRGC